MHWLLTIILTLALLLIGVIVLEKGQSSAGGLMAGHLSPCPSTPNCVCSEISPMAVAYIEPFVIVGDAQYAWHRLRAVIEQTNGDVVADNGEYMWVTYKTQWLRFIDDVEFRSDEANHVIHVRSASRIGRSDFSVNRNRMIKLRKLYEQLQIDQDTSAAAIDPS